MSKLLTNNKNQSISQWKVYTYTYTYLDDGDLSSLYPSLQINNNPLDNRTDSDGDNVNVNSSSFIYVDYNSNI